jgi:hypothetical protein
MKFFTKDLYLFLQREDVPWEIREARWAAAAGLYQEHLASIGPHLPDTINQLCKNIFHDGVIATTQRPSLEDLILEIDSRGCPWGPRGQCTLSFRGVRSVAGLEACLKATWLYQEAHLDPDARFNLQVLLACPSIRDVSELCVVADDVELVVTDTDACPTPVVGIDIPLVSDGGWYVWTKLDDSDGREGWYYIKDGVRQRKSPPVETLEQMQTFARGIGATLAGDRREEQSKGS